MTAKGETDVESADLGGDPDEASMDRGKVAALGLTAEELEGSVIEMRARRGDLAEPDYPASRGKHTGKRQR